MLSIKNIRTVARYERKILFRSWFFRIFSILSLGIIGIFIGTATFQNGAFTWGIRSLSSSIVYNSVFLLNIVQSIIAMFLASDFMKRDKKLDTAEVLFIRPMSNTDYVLGKTWGIVTLFFYLNLLILIEAFIFMLASPEIQVNLIPFAVYFLLLSIPSLIFILGLSFILMSILKNQSLTFLILLAYIAAILFYLGEKANFIFDYLAFRLPMVYSDIVGFGNFQEVLSQRMFYLFLGLGFIFLSILLLKRLTQSSATKVVSLILFTISIGIAVFFGYTNLHTYYNNIHKRAEMIELSAKYFDVPTATVHFYNIKVIHKDQLGFMVDMQLLNNTKQDLNQLIFTLNPGFTIESMMLNGKEVSFESELHILKVNLPTAMKPNSNASLSMRYYGKIDPSVNYLDIEQETIDATSSSITSRIDQQFSFVKDDYTLLTVENLWYPYTGVRYDPTRPAVFKQNFSKFKIEVQTKPELTAITQGQAKTDSLGNFEFMIRDPLPQVSLAIGEYEIRQTELSGVKVGLAYLKGHNYFDEYFDEVGDTVDAVIENFLDNYERPMQLFYSYPQFTLVEVPLQYKALQHAWTATLETSQPQMVFFPEKGFNVRSADFKSTFKWRERREQRENSGETSKQIQASVLRDFITQVFGATNAQVNFRAIGEGTMPLNPYSIYPNYYYYLNFISSEDVPVLNYAFETYLRKSSSNPRQNFMFQATGLGDEEKANRLLDGTSLKELIANNEEPAALNNVLQSKGSYLLTYIQKHFGDEDFDIFLTNFFYYESFKNIKFQDFANQIKEKYDLNLDQFINNWYTSKEVPTFITSDLDVIQTVNDNQVVFLSKIRIENTSNVNGLVKFTIEAGGGGGFRRGNSGGNEEADVRIYMIEANTTKEIQMLSYNQPRGINFSTMISRNIPSSRRFVNRGSEEISNYDAVEYEKVINKPIIKTQPGEIVVDNTDEGFEIHDPSGENPIKRMFIKEDEVDKYVGMGWGRAPATWSLAAQNDFYGDYIHSARFIRNGDGTKYVSWTTPLPSAGYYDIYVHLIRNRRRGWGNRGGGNKEQYYNYTVYHEDGVEEVALNLADTDQGWNLLGNFYISSDSAKITLSDKSEADRIIADAVKWVKEKK